MSKKQSGAKFAKAPGLHEGKVKALFSTSDAFVSMCQIVREDETIGFMTPTYTQRKLLDAYHNNNWVIVNKFRQAKITTISVMLLLRDCMYLEGVKGLLIAERQDTAEDIFERILFAYQRLPDDVRMPLAPGKKAGATQMQFVHGGGIKVLTAGGRSPAIGRSIDRLVITEFGEAQWQKKAAINITSKCGDQPWKVPVGFTHYSWSGGKTIVASHWIKASLPQAPSETTKSSIPECRCAT